MKIPRRPFNGDAFSALPAFRSTPLTLALLFVLLAGGVRAQVRLTEFMAVNTTGLTDEEGVPRPWIELWNSSQTTVANLNNYRLTDGVNTWTFPGVQIMPDGFMIVHASGKDRKTVTSPLHTNFIIPPAGGTLSLLNGSGAVISSLENYPAQQADVSWGRDEWDTAAAPAATGRYHLPTPGGRNNFDGPGVAGRVVIGTSGRAFTNI